MAEGVRRFKRLRLQAETSACSPSSPALQRTSTCAPAESLLVACSSAAFIFIRGRLPASDAPCADAQNMSDADADLPKAVIKRIIKAKVAELCQSAEGSGKRDVQVSREALAAFTQATKVFISYVAGAAHDVCKEGKRSTVLPKDVVQALGELNFGAFIPQLEQLLAGASSPATVSATAWWYQLDGSSGRRESGRWRARRAVLGEP